MEKPLRVELPLHHAFRTFKQSYNRTKYFSSITDTLKEEHLPKSWCLEDPSGITHSIPYPNDQKQLLEAYKHFNQLYLLRDLVESLSLSIDQVYLRVMAHGKRAKSTQTLIDVLTEEEKKEFNDFQYIGLTSKLKNLFRKLEIDRNEEDFKVLQGLKSIRDCLSHHYGIVREQDGSPSKGNNRKFSWLVIEPFLEEIHSGKKSKLKFGTPIETESDLCLEITQKHKSFKIGEPLSFSSLETYQIGFSLNIIVDRLMHQIARAKRFT